METPARWQIPRIDPTQVEKLVSTLGVHPPVARVLVGRGFHDPAAAARFLRPSLDQLHDPFLLQGMHEAVARLKRAIQSREKILLYGDYDVDGATSIVILKKALDRAGGLAGYHVPHRLKDGYGMRAEVIRQAAADGVTLIVSLDTGIRAAEMVRLAAELGIDVVVTDHHLPDSELPPACAVLNPKRPDCPYPDKELCGAGVTFKLVQALFTSLDWPRETRDRLLESFLKLVAIGTVADVVPLVGENRVFVKFGLDGLRNVRNPGLRALLAVAGFAAGDRPSAGQVAFRIAPRMNAAGRMANASDAVDLFLTDDDQRARELAGQLHELNQERQQAESEIVRSILEECERQPVTDAQAVLVFSGVGWHRGVVGVVANRLVERYHRPVIVLSEEPEEGLAHGSGRSVPSFHLLEALETMPELFSRFGGHRQAVGLSVPLDRLNELRSRLNAYALPRFQPGDFRPVLEIDAHMDLSETCGKAIEEVLSLAPFGAGNPPPVFALRGLEVHERPVLWKENHLRLRFHQNGRFLNVKAWNFARRMEEFERGARLDLAVCFEEDTYLQSRGYWGWTAVLKDARRASSGHF